MSIEFADALIEVNNAHVREVERLTAERDGLAKALREIATTATPPDHNRPGVKLDAIYDLAEAALAALPPKEEA